jgi:hypothetical protein
LTKPCYDVELQGHPGGKKVDKHKEARQAYDEDPQPDVDERALGDALGSKGCEIAAGHSNDQCRDECQK